MSQQQHQQQHQHQAQRRINFPRECEQNLNKVIAVYQELSELYQVMACHFMQAEVADRDFEMLLWRRSDKLQVGVAKLIRFMNKRGGRVQFQDIPQPTALQWKDVLEAHQCSLSWEKKLYQTVAELIQVAQKQQDPETIDYCQKKILPKQSAVIKTVGDNIQTFQKMSEKQEVSLTEFLWQKHELEPVVIKETLKLMQKTPYVYPRYIKKSDQEPTNPRVILPTSSRKL